MNRKALSSILFLFIGLLPSGVFAQVVGSVFPDMHTETVNDKAVNLPNDTKGKFTLLGLAFSKKSEDDLNTWLMPAYERFMQKPEGAMNKLFGSYTYDVNVYFIPMFTGVKTVATKTAKRKALKQLDERLLPYILFYSGKLKQYKDALAFEKRDIPYFFVLDANGKIVYATSGRYDDNKMEKIESLLE